MPLKLWWALAAVAAIAVFYAALGARRKDRGGAAVSLVVAVGAGIAAYVFRTAQYQAENLPIYSYGVMLGLSLVVGWYLTLTLAERDGLPKETMANCYVVTAIAAILGSRILYVATNPDEFKTAADFFALRRGGLVAYGGFLGGLIGSWLFLQRHKIRLMPWADVAVPSLASGLLITRIGCYLFGCDFGKRLPGDAPGFLKKMGTFPHWAAGTLEGGDGSPAFVKHLEVFRGTPQGAELVKNNVSFPVHPTQIYEAIVGLGLLALLLWQRKHQKFRGQIFFLFAFGYGYLRFILEILRDDSERGEFGPLLPEHWLIAGSLFVMAIAFTFGVSLGITNAKVRTVSRVLAFVPPIVAFVLLKPQSFGKQITIQLSTSQWIGLLSAVAVAWFYAKAWEQARKTPKLAMGLASLGDFTAKEDEGARRGRDDDEDEDEDDADDGDVERDDEVAAEAEAPPRKGKGKKAKGKKKKGLVAPAAKVEAKADDDASEDDDDGDADDEELEAAAAKVEAAKAKIDASGDEPPAPVPTEAKKDDEDEAETA